MKLPAKIEPEQLTAIIDTREQTPLDLSPLGSESGTLCSGDYSVKGLEHVVRVERKSLPDLVGVVGRDRERFDREVQRLLSFPVRALVIESNWREIEMGGWRGQVTPKQVVGSLLGWAALGLPVLMFDDHKRCGQYTSRLLYTTAKRRYRELRSLAGQLNV